MAERIHTAPHLIVYDGICGFCSRAVELVESHDRDGSFQFLSLQEPSTKTLLENRGIDPELSDTVLVFGNWDTPDEFVLDRSEAALFITRHLSPPWNALRVIRHLPLALRDRAYDFVARHRRRLPSSAGACPLPARVPKTSA